jgi:hypothetical protein
MTTRHGRIPYGLVIALVSLATISACSFSATTAHLTGLKVGTDKAMTTETSRFGRTDTIYAQSGVANNAGKVTLQWHLIAEKVQGQRANTAIPEADKSFDLDGDGTASYNVSPPTAGWPKGTYKIQVDMVYVGRQKDQKTAEFTVS